MHDKIEKQLLLAKDFDVVYTNYETIDASGNKVPKKKNITPVTDNKELKKTLLTKNVILGSGSGVLLKREVAEKTGLFNSNLKVGEDWDYWARIAWLDFTFGYINESLVTIRYNNSSMQSTSTKIAWKTSIETILKSFLRYNLTGENKALVFKRLLFNSYLFGNSFREIVTYYFNAVKNDRSFAFHFDALFLMLKFYPRSLKRIFKS